jgi:hypothetical protein
VSIDWVSAAGIATAVGTALLAVATFQSTRTANRAARSAERARLESLQPILIPSPWEAPVQKVNFIDGKLMHVSGGRASIEVTDQVVYMIISVRNVGRGLAVLHGWALPPDRMSERRPLSEFHLLQRDIFVAPDYDGFVQVASRDPESAEFSALVGGERSDVFWIDLLYSDIESTQRLVTRFAVTTAPEGADERTERIASVVRYWTLDGPDPHDSRGRLD